MTEQPHHHVHQEPTPLLRAIGCLDSPNWGDERERTVYLESIAVAYQVTVIIALWIAALMVWVLDRSTAMWALALFVGVSLPRLLAVRYTQRHGVNVQTVFDKGNRMEGLMLLTPSVVFLVGFVRAGTARDLIDLMTALGMLAGFAAGLVAVVTLKRATTRRQHDVPDDVFD